MGCKCRERRRRLNIIRKTAKLYAEVSNEPVQVYKYLDNNETLYNFEPIDNNRKNIIEIIKP